MTTPATPRNTHAPTSRSARALKRLFSTRTLGRTLGIGAGLLTASLLWVAWAGHEDGAPEITVEGALANDTTGATNTADGASRSLSPSRRMSSRREPARHTPATAARSLELSHTLRVSGAPSPLVVDAQLTFDRPGTYYAYAELWGSDGGSRNDRPLLFARRRWIVSEAGRHTVSLTFSPDSARVSAFSFHNLRSRVLRNFQVRRVDEHPSQLLAEVEQIALPESHRINTPPEGVSPAAQISDRGRAADLTSAIQIPAGSSERRQ